MRKDKALVTTLVLILVLAGCSAASLRCGVDGESSFVELAGTPQSMSQNMRAMGELCGFAYEKVDQQLAELTILESAL